MRILSCCSLIFVSLLLVPVCYSQKYPGRSVQPVKLENTHEDPMLIAGLTNMLCSMCCKIQDTTKQKKCIGKFCLRNVKGTEQAPCRTGIDSLKQVSSQLNYVKLRKDFTNWKRIIGPESVIPILLDMACKACSKISDTNKRKQCTKKFCQSTGSKNAPMSAAASAVKTKLQNELFGNKRYPDDRIPRILGELTNMLCSLCSNMSDPVKKKKCTTKFCLQKSKMTEKTSGLQLKP
ncbi:unnamed protein product [Mytilus edulis]|uniref:Uncharacterized protein n=1 Tax=Mytilus edulis TaxID=6550 RepID=A0A8S3UXQ5_MYTED|nr:unnamed protein product [Mytilus edulis]